ncbi:DsrE family protein [Hyphococcus formosus]|uniref:DsrE family protein n=1 Tax=Hyphococcus formosus TaxID=3143534 RepID=UPI00398BAEF8
MRQWIAAFMLVAASLPVAAQPAQFSTGPVIEKYGKVAEVDTNFEIPDDMEFRISFDAVKGAEPGELNRTLTSAARFINMHARAGVDPDEINIAIVAHGKAVLDLTNPEFYAANIGGENANADLISTLLKNRVRIIVCGQSASAQGVGNGDLLPGVETALSAMTAHAVLQSNGYTLNPF